VIKLGRNDLCWCGSQKKYKKCHLEREAQNPVPAGQLDTQLRLSNFPVVCFYGTLTGDMPCPEKPIASHTVPRSMLSRIALSGHVYGYRVSIQNFDNGQGVIKPERIGISDASTLPLFCKKHDSEVFSPLEIAPFIGTEEQCFLLLYRALCLELFKKNQEIAWCENQEARALIERGKDREQQEKIHEHFKLRIALSQIAQRDTRADLEKLETMLHKGKYDDLRAYIILFDKVPEVFCAAATFPECDFSGCELQSLNTIERLDLVSFSLIPTQTGGAFVLAWEAGNDGAITRLVESLDQLSDSAIPHAVLRFVFSFCENHYIQPSWWDLLDPASRAGYEQRFHEAPLSTHPGRLLDDGISCVNWNVVRRFRFP
jgi:hypothetical protein